MVMETFEEQFEDLDVQSSYIEASFLSFFFILFFFYPHCLFLFFLPRLCLAGWPGDGNGMPLQTARLYTQSKCTTATTATTTVQNAMGSATANMTPTDDVDALIMQVAEEHGLEVEDAFDELRVGTSTGAEVSVDEDEALNERLAQLRAQAAH